MNQLTSRQQVKLEETWKLSDLFATDELWKEELLSFERAAEGITSFAGKLAERAENLLNCLEAHETLMERIVLVRTYAHLKLAQDGSNTEAQAQFSLTRDILAKVHSSLSFIRSEIIAIPDETISRFQEQQPKLNKYQVFLSDLQAQKPYALSPDTEKALSALTPVLDAPYSIYSTSKSTDLSFSPFQDGAGLEKSLSFALYEDQYELSADTTERRNAYQSFDKTLARYENTYAATYATEVNKQVILSKLRGHETTTDMLLHAQKVTPVMYNNQLDIIYQELAPHMQRLAKLKKEVLGLDELMFCDLKAPLDPEFQPETTYEKVKETIEQALSPMGEEYMNIIRQGLSERWVDRAENIGKQTGAFCSSPYGSHPFILMTWTGNLRNAFILAHELGHAGHFYLANHYQPISAVRPSMYCIEAPSTMNELFLGHYLLEQSDDPRLKRWVLLQFIGTYYHNFVTHLLEGEFQRRVYQLADSGQPLTAELLRQTKYEVLKGFWGDSVTLDEGAGRTWMRQPHYYMGLYPYTYSAGLTASTAAFAQIQEKGQPMIERWLEMLKAGGTKKPLELFKDAGIDMSNPDTIRSAVSYVGELISKLEAAYQ